MKNKGFAVLIAILVIAGMLGVMGGQAIAEPYHILSGRDKVGTYGQDGKSARLGYLNSVVFEGDTSDTNETRLYATDPTGDNVLALPDASGTLATTDGSFSGTIPDTSNTNILVSNGVSFQSKTMSGDATIANTGALTISASAVESSMIAIANVQASDMFYNTVSFSVAAGATGMEIAVEAGSLLISTAPVSGISNLYTITKSDFVGGTWFINTDAHPAAMVGNGLFHRPTP